MFRIGRSRRLATGRVLVATVCLFCCATEAMGQLRVRQNYRNLTPAERQKFRDALVAIKRDTSDTGTLRECSAPTASVGKLCTADVQCDTSPGNGTCDPSPTCEWDNKYDKYVCWHDRCGCFETGGSQHGRPQILPWHRELFRRFEEELRAIPGFNDVTIPYWKWTDPFPSHLDDAAGDNNFMGSTSSGFFYTTNILCSAPPEKLGDTCSINSECDTSPGNGVCGPWLTRLGSDPLQVRDNASAVGTITQQQVDAALTKTPYDAPDAALPDGWIHSNPARGFRPYWENLHNAMHGWVGGDLSAPASAADDPVFWLAHSYFDCMWAAWETLHNPDYRPDKLNFPADAPVPSGEDADDLMGPWNVKTIRNVLATTVLGYIYDTSHIVPAVSSWRLLILIFGLLLLGYTVITRKRVPESARF